MIGVNRLPGPIAVGRLRGGYNRGMLIYAGIDEAGYGPMFGPLVIARSVFILPGCDPGDEPPCLWKLLDTAVCDSIQDRRRRIAVNDSKKLYTPASGLKHLERGVLSFAHNTGIDCDCLDGYLKALAYDADSHQPDQLWYLDDDGEPALPTMFDAGQLAISRSQLRLAAQSAGVQIKQMQAAVIFEDRYNRMVAATRSKARCAWTFVSGHLDAIWRSFGEHHPRVVIDRQGGRTRYADLLSTLFENAQITVTEETPLSSVYTIRRDGRSMTLSFEVESEARHLPVALASMTAKYTRELLMERFNRFWRKHLPDVKPTKGYAQDGKRFLAEIETTLGELNIPREQIIRQR